MKNVEDFYPLSPMQQGMLFQSLLAPESGVYVEQTSVTLRGDLDVEAFQQAWQQVVDRYAILRTAFAGEGLKEPVQLVRRRVPISIDVEDWRDVPADEQAARLDAYLADERRRGFDLSKAPLMRLGLLRTADDAYTFVLTHHHILLDGWSLPVLFGEVFAFYEAGRMGQPLTLDAPKPYRDYIVWLKQQDMSAAEAYWREALAGFGAPTPLVMDDLQTGDVPEGPAYDEIAHHLPREATASLEELARQHHLTMSTIVQGAWALLLARTSGEDDVAFGATVSGRPADLPGAETMVGLFINTLPVRVKVDPDVTVGAWLEGLQAQTAEMRQYEFSSLIDVQRWSDVPRGLPLFNSILVFENYPIASTVEGQSASLALEDVRSIEQTELPLTVVAGAADELVLKIAYDGHQFAPETIHRMLGHLAALLEGIAADTGTKLSDLPLIGEDERADLLRLARGEAVDFPLGQCVHELFEAQAAEQPDALALVFQDERLTYAELNRRANQLAHTLVARGAGPEVLVGLAVERSAEMIVGMLGILKAGGAYLPLEPSYPPERLSYMMQDSGVGLLLTQEHLAGALPAHDAEVLLLDADWPEIAEASGENPPHTATPDTLAYVIYTSGSTGQPKGSLLPHRGLTNQTCVYIRDFGYGPDQRALQFMSYSFDGSVMEIFPALASGTALYLAPREDLLNTAALRALLQEEHITHLAMPPAMLALVLPDDLPDLRLLISGGEALLPEVAARWLADERRLINAYGPTECTVCATWHEVSPADVAARRIPIGGPIANTTQYVLDGQMRPQPVGVPGELYIGGVGVGRGYLNRPDLTAEKFIPDPFSDEPGARLYRTGDLVRWLPGGELEFMGRTDDQVKVRGFRIELGEIERALDAHPAVKQAAVTVQEETPGQKWLAAYIVPLGEDAAAARDLRAFLGERLPDYMIPSAFVTLDEMPLNPSGKIDRKALPAPPADRLDTGREIVPPRDVLETRLVQLWEEILGVQPIGVTDNFFELGGHSLLAMRLIAQVQKRLEVDVPLVRLFQEPTIEQLASLIRQQSQLSSTLVPLQTEGEQPPLFIIHPTGGSVHWYTDLAHCLAPEQPLYGLQAQGLLGDAPLLTEIEAMAEQYVVAIREVQPEGPYRLASWSMGVAIAYEMAQQLTAQGDEVAFLAMMDQGPRMPLGEPEDYAAFLMETFAQHLPITLEELRALDEAEQLPHVWQVARDTGWVYPDVTLEQFSYFVTVLRAHNDAWRAYTPQPYPGQVTLLRAVEQPEDGPAARDMGWGELAQGGVAVYDVPGDHLTMMHEPHVEALAVQLTACLKGGSVPVPPA